LKGKEYVQLIGNKKLREILIGTRYLASNPKIVSIGVGTRGLKNIAKGGFILGMVVGVSVEVLDFIFRQDKTWVDLVSGVGVEAVKAVLSGAAGLLVGGLAIAFAGAATVAVVPLVAYPSGSHRIVSGLT
jgi:hypothetical protein